MVLQVVHNSTSVLPTTKSERFLFLSILTLLSSYLFSLSATSIEVSLSYSPSPTEIDDSEGTLLYLIAMPVLVVIVGAIGLAVWICVSSKTFIWKVKGKKYVTQSIE